MDNQLRVVVRNAQQTFADLSVRSLRFPTETGQVGLRHRCERTVLTLEPGLVLARTNAHCHYIGTAGGLLSCDGKTATLLTPLAVIGDTPDDVLPQLERALEAPSDELKARAAFSKLETAIAREIQKERQRKATDGSEA